MNVRGTFVETQWMLWKASVKAMVGFGVGKTAVRQGQRTMITQDSGPVTLPPHATWRKSTGCHP